MKSITVLRSSISAVLILLLLGFVGSPNRFADRAADRGSIGAQAGTVRATGPDQGTTLEDRVEVMWTVDAPIAPSSSFHIKRKELPAGTLTLVQVAAPSVSIWEDFTAKPNVEYDYCVYEVTSAAVETQIGVCDIGKRVIVAPTGLEISKGTFEDKVLLTWNDRSQIEGGFNVYRDGGRALNFDGSNDYVETPGTTTLSNSFSFEFWAKRTTTNSDDFVINLEMVANGDPVNVDLEVGFIANGRFQFRFGANSILTTPNAYTDTAWHHWAIAYDAPNRRRFIYRDGVRVAMDVIPASFRPSGLLEIGRRDKQGSAANRGYYHGQLDEIRYWNIALTEEQVAARRLGLLTGSDAGLSSYWPMDITGGLVAPDVKGELTGTLVNMTQSNFVINALPGSFYAQVGADLTSFADRSAVPGFQSYIYRLAAFEDIDGNGVFSAPPDFESTSSTDAGWRAILTPPGDVVATDGQYNDRVEITWTDLSTAETNYRIYRGTTLIGTVPANTVAFTDLSPTVPISYCVAAFGGGVESIKSCDEGRAGGLQAPLRVVATDNVFDDRVSVSWTDSTSGEDGFEVYRATVTPPSADALIATLGADATEFNDITALQDTQYNYCVRSFSKSDPLSPAYSTKSCTATPGRRAIVLDPTELTASAGDFEDRVELAWRNASTTAMLFMVYRNNNVIQVLDHNMIAASDTGIASDTDINYCVTAATVTSGNAATLQGRVAQVLGNIKLEDTVRKTNGEQLSTLNDRLVAVRVALGGEATGPANVLGVEDLVESNPICTVGSRSLLAATELTATDNDFEGHVQLKWTENSQVESGYYVLRGPGSGALVPIDTLSANRTTYGDYTGTPGVQYRYSIQAFDAFGVSATSAVDPGKRTLNPPTVFLASDGTSESVVELQWKDNSAAELGYRIYRNAETVPIFETGKNEPAYSDLVPQSMLGKQINYHVKAFDLYGESLAASNSGYTMLEAPANVNASDVYETGVVLVWVDRSNVEVGYEVTRRPVGPSTTVTALASLGQDVTTFNDNPPGSPGDKFEYCVLATLDPTTKSLPVCDIGQKFDPNSSGGGGSSMAGIQPLKIVSPYKLGNSNDLARGIRFGDAVALNGSDALIGVPGANTGAFIKQSDGIAFPWSVRADSNLWTAGDRIEPPVLAPDCCNYNTYGQEFGRSVDISGNYAAIGDPWNDDDGAGSFTIYKKSGGVWNKQLEHIRKNYPGLDNTGNSVALANEYAVVGNPQYAQGGFPTDHGGATVCNSEVRAGNGGGCDRDSGIPRLELHIPSNDRLQGAKFGQSVDIMRDGNDLFALVGAPGNEAAYLFVCNITNTTTSNPVHIGCSATNDWVRTRVFDSPFATGSDYGAAVALNNQMVVIGAPGAQGIVVYERNGILWDETPVTIQPKAKKFGFSLSLLGNKIVVGAPGEVISGIKDAGATYVYEYETTTTETTELVRYDARAGGRVIENARFGSSVAFDGAYYLIGAPGDDGFVINAKGDADSSGAAYSIPFGFTPPTTAVIPTGVALATPGNIRASDGTAADRIQIRWKDESQDEDGHVIYRGNTSGEFDRLAEVQPNVQFFDDVKAAPGEAYTYCVAAFFDESETERSCDVGWREPNGTIAGRVAEKAGAGTDGATVCIVPSPNKALLFDGTGGFIEAMVGDEFKKQSDFSIEAWIRPHDVTGVASIVSKAQDWSFQLNGDQLQFTLFRDMNPEETVTATRAITPGAWTHVAVSFVSNASVLSASFFIDSTAAGVSPVTGFASIKDTVLTIGHRGDESMTYFNGEIDEVRVWTGGRTAAEIQSLWTTPLVGDEENLLGYWPLDEGSRRIAPDLSASANHGHFKKGVYLVDQGADLNVCVQTGDDGNYSIAGIRYGDLTEFNVIPTRSGRNFSPSFKKITLAIDTPVQNEVFFSDITAFSVTGLVQYVDTVRFQNTIVDTLMCPVPDVVMHVAKTNVPTGDNVKGKTSADGSYAVSVDPSRDDADVWFFMPELVDPQNGALTHTFSPNLISSVVRETKSGLSFIDETRYKLSGNFTGGDPAVCGKDIGEATIRLYTEDGCYNRTFVVNSAVANGAFPDLDLPPLKYLMQVVDVNTASVPDRAEDIRAFFAALGSVEVDLTKGDLQRNLIYRAPLILQVGGLGENLQCVGGITQVEDGVTLRTLPAVQTIKQFANKTLTIQVLEDYGNNQTCEVQEGTVTIYDAIADRVDADSTMSLVPGGVVYKTLGASPNIFSGARIQGVDRSFQKPLTVVAQVEGRKSLVKTEWAIVEGFRERAATFVSATTEQFPLLILHDPPGSNSYASIEKGATWCNQISNTQLVGGGAGPYADIALGFVAHTGFSFGAHLDIAAGAGVFGAGTTLAGREDERLNGKNIEICYTTTEEFKTSSDPGWVNEDVFVGVALNLVFAIADVLKIQPACTISLSETLAADLNQTKPFETAYAYGQSHISSTLIPELENLIRIGGDATLSGPINGQQNTVRLVDAVENWKKHLKLNETLKAAGIAASDCPPSAGPLCKEEKNRSFSGGTEFTHTESADTSRVIALENTKIYVETENTVGAIFNIGFDSRIGVKFNIKSEWNSQNETTAGNSKTIGYTLADEDAGDYFSVDVGKDPRYGTFVFDTKSGRSSNPWEGNTQKRDNPIITADPPIQFDLDPSRSGRVQLTLINGSESNERRRYVIAAPAETNPQNLRMIVAGSALGGTREFLLDPGKAITVDMQVLPTTNFAHRRVGVMMYPPDEYNLWIGDTRLPFALSDTAFFSVLFDSTGGNVFTSVLREGWNWVSINREGASVDSVFSRVPVSHGDRIRNQWVESRYDSTYGWTGDLQDLKPGVGYRVKMKNPGFLRMTGEAVKTVDPIKMKSGWNWVGYLPAKSTNVGEALASLDRIAIEGDAVVGQNGFAQYVHGIGWVGTLKDMMPGDSYALYLTNGGDLAYPLEPTDAQRPIEEPREITVEGPEWKMSSNEFTTSMTVVAEVKVGSRPLDQTTTKIAVFAGDEIRGTGEVHYIKGLDQYLAFIQVYGEFDEEQPMRVHVFDGESKILYEDVATINYKAQDLIGQPTRPVLLDLNNAGAAPDLLDLPETFALHPNYPNPFSESSTIGYDLPEAAAVKIAVYDLLGRRVVMLVDGEQPAGRHKAVFDARQLASGIYFYRMEAGDFKEVGKMIVVK